MIFIFYVLALNTTEYIRYCNCIKNLTQVGDVLWYMFQNKTPFSFSVYLILTIDSFIRWMFMYLTIGRSQIFNKGVIYEFRDDFYGVVIVFQTKWITDFFMISPYFRDVLPSLWTIMCENKSNTPLWRSLILVVCRLSSPFLPFRLTNNKTLQVTPYENTAPLFVTVGPFLRCHEGFPGSL